VNIGSFITVGVLFVRCFALYVELRVRFYFSFYMVASEARAPPGGSTPAPTQVAGAPLFLVDLLVLIRCHKEFQLHTICLILNSITLAALLVRNGLCICLLTCLFRMFLLTDHCFTSTMAANCGIVCKLIEIDTVRCHALLLKKT
jgi:hypothetical protein